MKNILIALAIILLLASLPAIACAESTDKPAPRTLLEKIISFFRGFFEKQAPQAPAESEPETQTTTATTITGRKQILDTSTYTFSGITAPSTTHIAWNATDTKNPPSALALTSEVQFSTAEYGNVSSSDDNRAFYNGSKNRYAAHKFHFKITDAIADITSINITWEGYGCVGGPSAGSCTGNGGANLSVWNFTASSWKRISANTGTTESTLSQVLSSGITDIVNSSGSIFILAESYNTSAINAPPYSSIWTDFVRLIVSYTSGGGGAQSFNITVASPLGCNATTNYTSTSILMNVSNASSMIASCKYSFDSWATNYSMDLNGPYSAAGTWEAPGSTSYTVYFWCNDTSGNVNNTEHVIFCVILGNATISYITPPTPRDNTTVNGYCISVNASVGGGGTNISNCTLAWLKLNSSDPVQFYNMTMTKSSSGKNASCFLRLYNSSFSGNYGFWILAYDVVGNLIQACTTRWISFVRRAPRADFIAPSDADGAIVSRNSSYVNASAIEVGYGIQSCTLEWNNTNTTMSQIGRWNPSTWRAEIYCSLNKSDAEGNYTYRVYVTDWYNNLNASANRTIVFDMAPPSITFVSPTDADGALVGRAWTKINATADDIRTSIASCTLEWNGVNETMTRMSSGKNISCYTKKTAVQGNYTYKVYAADSAGNLANSSTRHVNLSTSVPTIAFVAPTDENGADPNRKWTYINVSVSSPSLSIDVCTLEWNGANETITKLGTGTTVSCYINKSAGEGTYTYKIYANDTGDSTSSTETRTITFPSQSEYYVTSIITGFGFSGRFK